MTAVVLARVSLASSTAAYVAACFVAHNDIVIMQLQSARHKCGELADTSTAVDRVA
jgi:hypothetical protein